MAHFRIAGADHAGAGMVSMVDLWPSVADSGVRVKPILLAALPRFMALMAARVSPYGRKARH